MSVMLTKDDKVSFIRQKNTLKRFNAFFISGAQMLSDTM